jgi:hypothetical protein
MIRWKLRLTRRKEHSARSPHPERALATRPINPWRHTEDDVSTGRGEQKEDKKEGTSLERQKARQQGRWKRANYGARQKETQAGKDRGQGGH